MYNCFQQTTEWLLYKITFIATKYSSESLRMVPFLSYLAWGGFLIHGKWHAFGVRKRASSYVVLTQFRFSPGTHPSCFLSLKLEVVRDTACCLKSETFLGIDSGSSFTKESQWIMEFSQVLPPPTFPKVKNTHGVKVFSCWGLFFFSNSLK